MDKRRFARTHLVVLFFAISVFYDSPGADEQDLRLSIGMITEVDNDSQSGGEEVPSGPRPRKWNARRVFHNAHEMVAMGRWAPD